MPTIRNTTLALCLLGASTLGCAASKQEIRTARTSGYKTDFAIVYSRALNIMRAHYPNLHENASAGTIRTSWHAIRIAQHGQGDPRSQQTRDNSSTNPQNNQANPLSTTKIQRKSYFIRFDVYVVGGKPWRVRIDGYASEWELGAVPTVLSGANVPSWLKGRTDSLYVELYRGLAKHAVKLKSTVLAAGPKRRVVAPPKPVDLNKFGKIPAAAARRIYYVADAAKSRDFKKLRNGMADEFTWNLGATPSAKAAIITWQADARVLEQLLRVLEAGCKVEAGSKTKVTCAMADTAANASTYTAAFGIIAGKWKMTSFATRD